MTKQYIETPLMIPGPVGDLEAVLTSLKPPTSMERLALICHPHPLHGGTMNNKVVTTVVRSFRDADIASIRFNYRGVGQSGGEYANAEGEVDDLMAIYQWVLQQYPQAKIYLAGFSFGAYITYRASNAINPQQLITIAPAVHHHDYAQLPLPQCPWIVVQGDDDEVVPAEQVYAWLNALPLTPTVLRFSNAGHFFHGKLIDLRQQLTELINL